MKKALIIIPFALILLLPFHSFADTVQVDSPQYISLLEQLLSLLEQELTAIESQSTPVTATSTTTIDTSNASSTEGQIGSVAQQTVQDVEGTTTPTLPCNLISAIGTTSAVGPYDQIQIEWTPIQDASTTLTAIVNDQDADNPGATPFSPDLRVDYDSGYAVANYQPDAQVVYTLTETEAGYPTATCSVNVP